MKDILIMEENNNFYNKFNYETSNRLTKIETILENQNVVLNQILEQAKKTNGRVNVLELWKANITGKQAGIAAAVSTLIAVAGLLVNHLLGG